MRPKERRETGQSDLLRSRLDSTIDMNHALVKLARTKPPYALIHDNADVNHRLGLPGRAPILSDLASYGD